MRRRQSGSGLARPVDLTFDAAGALGGGQYGRHRVLVGAQARRELAPVQRRHFNIHFPATIR